MEEIREGRSGTGWMGTGSRTSRAVYCMNIAAQLQEYGSDATAAEKVEQKVQNAGNRRYFKTADGPQEFVGVVTDVFTKPGYNGQGTDYGVAFDVDGEEIVVAQGATAWVSSVQKA